MSNKFHEWERGDKVKLARNCNLSKSYICDVLKGRKRATPENATTIANEARKMGKILDRLDLIYPQESTNPLIECIQEGVSDV